MAILRSVYGSGFVKRIGNVVGQKAGEGQYRICAYQPEVTNPRTTAQQTQRSKFSFLGKMAVMFGNDAMVGMSNTKFRTAQLAFISRNMPNVMMDVLVDPTQVSPTLTLRGVGLSDGGEVTPVLDCEAGDETHAKINARTTYGIDDNRPAGLMVVGLCLNEVERSGYRASVAYVPYASWRDGVAKVEGVQLPIDVGAGQTPQTGFPCIIYAYNVRKQAMNQRTRFGSLGVYTVNYEEVYAAEDSFTTVVDRDLYSKTVSQIINLQ